jgi:hypothetical protein
MTLFNIVENAVAVRTDPFVDRPRCLFLMQEHEEYFCGKSLPDGCGSTEERREACQSYNLVKWCLNVSYCRNCPIYSGKQRLTR